MMECAGDFPIAKRSDNRNTALVSKTLMKTNSLKLAAIALVCIGFTSCKKNNDTAGKESKISGSPSDVPVALTPKWTVGQRYVMRMESAQTMQMPNFGPGGGQPGTNTQTVENNFSQEYSLAVTNAGDGNRGMEMEILAVELQVTAGERTQINYDSRNKVAREGGPVPEVFDRIIGGTIRYLVSPENKVLKVEGIKELFDRLDSPADDPAANPAANPAAGRRRRAAAGGAPAMLRGIYNEETFKQMIELSGAPPKAVRVGETWNHTREVAAPTIGKLAVNTTNTFRGWQEHDGRKCARVDFTGSMNSSEGTNDAAMPMQMTLQDGSISGRYWFSPELGASVETSVDQSYLVNVSGQLGRNPNAAEADASASFSMPIRQHVSVKLLEVKPVSQ